VFGTVRWSVERIEVITHPAGLGGASPRRSMWRCGDSNPVPPACKAGALPSELHPQGSPGGASWTRTRGLSLIRTAL
jgi:hypothetical protein